MRREKLMKSEFHVELVTGEHINLLEIVDLIGRDNLEQHHV